MPYCALAGSAWFNYITDTWADRLKEHELVSNLLVEYVTASGKCNDLQSSFLTASPHVEEMGNHLNSG